MTNDEIRNTLHIDWPNWMLDLMRLAEKKGGLAALGDRTCRRIREDEAQCNDYVFHRLGRKVATQEAFPAETFELTSPQWDAEQRDRRLSAGLRRHVPVEGRP